MTPASGAGLTVACPLCGAASPAGALSCAACNGLIHATELKQLTTNAQAAEQAGQTTEALRLWREALDLLPPATVQRQTVWEKVQALSLQVDREPASASAPPAKSPWMRRLGPIAAVALLAWKFKALVFVALTKGKVLLLGLTKLSTLSTMVLSLGAYWALYGWKFALGLVLSIYVHEMGHVHELRRFGIKASAPAFIPLLGAVVRMKQYPANPREDARVGLAGPRWGTWGAAATFVLYFWTQLPIYGVIAHFAAWINLFNLLPVWQLDGSRAFHALGRGQRGLAVIAIAAAWAATREGFLLILMALAIRRLFTRDYPPEGDRRALAEYAGLVVVLAAMLIVPVPVAK